MVTSLWQWRRQDFVTGGGEVRYGSIGGLEYEVPQSPVVYDTIRYEILF